MFGLILPGRQLITEFIQESKTSWICQIVKPREVANFALFFTDDIPPTEPIGVGVYCSFLPPLLDWQFIGALSGSRKSEIFTVGWPWMPEVRETLVLKLVIEPAPLIIEKLQISPPPDVRKEFARRTALNLFRFLESFGGPPELQNALDQWFVKFEHKYAIDPNFVLRSE